MSHIPTLDRVLSDSTPTSHSHFWTHSSTNGTVKSRAAPPAFTRRTRWTVQQMHS